MIQESSGAPVGNGRNQPAPPARTPVIFGILLAGGAVVAGLWWGLSRTPAPGTQDSAVAEPVPALDSNAVPSASSQPKSAANLPPALPLPSALPATGLAVLPQPAPNPPASSPKLPEPSPYTQQLLANLLSLDLRHGTLTPEEVAFWKQEYGKLVEEGAGALPAIRQFMEKNVDVNFASVQGGDQLGASTMRLAMIDALRQIGGADAQGVAAQLMQNTTNPREIATLARDLEAAAPEHYRDAALAAARNALAQAGANPAAVDTSPLFEVLQKFGGATAASDLELAAKKWNYYSPIALAALPDGAGVATLARMAQNTDGSTGSSSRFAWQMLAQLAPQYPDASKALLEQVSAGRVPDSAWYGIASALSGVQTFYGDSPLTTAGAPAGSTEPKSYRIPSNQQTYRSYNVSAVWTPDQIQRQIALVDQIRAANPVAAQMLEGVRATLAAPRPGP